MRAVDGRVLAGAAALAAIALLLGGAFAGLLAEGGRDLAAALGAVDAYMLRVARFTLWQAALSAVLSVAPAIFVARAIARHPAFPGRGLILRLFAVPLAIPSIVAALGVLALYGRSGYFAAPLTALGGTRWPGIYGLGGILVAHVFFNLPLATRLFVHALETIPADQRRLAAQLGMGAWPSFRFLEWPVLRAALPGVAGLVFMLCVTSFTVVLILGGGPRATTLEVAIYQSLRFDFDPARAVVLTALQLVLVVAMVAVLARLGADMAGDVALPVAHRLRDTTSRRERAANAIAIAAAFLFVAGPMAAVVLSGLSADLTRLAGEAEVHRAVATSLVLALSAALLCVLLSAALVAGRRRLEMKRRASPPSLPERLMDTGAGFVLVVPPIVIGAGWFVLLRRQADVLALAPVMVVTVNAVMAMPFAIRAIRPAHDAASHRHERLCAQLGITGPARIRIVDWPVLRGPLLTAFAFAMALSLGDLGVIALFGSEQVQTLPYLLLARMGSYRTADAAGLALLLGLVCLLLMLAADRGGRTAR